VPLGAAMLSSLTKAHYGTVPLRVCSNEHDSCCLYLLPHACDVPLTHEDVGCLRTSVHECVSEITHVLCGTQVGAWLASACGLVGVQLMCCSATGGGADYAGHGTADAETLQVVCCIIQCSQPAAVPLVAAVRSAAT
jgi:hypothetical protein